MYVAITSCFAIGSLSITEFPCFVGQLGLLIHSLRQSTAWSNCIRAPEKKARQVPAIHRPRGLASR